MIKIGINGFGRIGRITLRAAITKYLSEIKVVAINTSGSMGIEGWAHLFEFDSVYGKFKGQVKIEKGKGDELGVLVVNNQKIPLLGQRDPALIPWRKYGVDLVLEATGVFKDRKSASAHFKGEAKKIIVSAPAEGIKTFIMGVNHEDYKGELIINNASCTTNCVVPVTKIIKDEFGIQKGFINTAHAYTANQNVVDNSHEDLRRARAAGVNIIPTTTGATIATTEVIPSLKGLFGGLAFRVPVVCGSVTDFTFLTMKRTSKKEVEKAFKKAALGKYRKIVEITEKPLVSSDIIGNSASAVIDLSLLEVIDGDLLRVVAWYDNEWAYSCRLLEEAIWINEH
jgi:glyceraldehyde 3-phosphate dehydrogenase